MKIFGINIGRATLAAPPLKPGDAGAPSPGVAPQRQGLAQPLVSTAAGPGQVLSPFLEQAPPTDNPPQKQSLYLNPRWEPINISQNSTAIAVQTAIREAENGETRELFRFYRDSVLGDDHIQNCINARITALLSMPIAILPEDKKNPDDVAAAKACARMVKDCQNWVDTMAVFITSCFWPVVVQERIYRKADRLVVPPSGGPNGEQEPAEAGATNSEPPEPQLQWTLKKFENVNPMLFCFRWAYLTGGIAMGTASPIQQANLGLAPGNFMVDLERFEPFFKLWPTDNSGRIIYDAASSSYLDPSRHIVHRNHLITQFRDNWGGPGRAILGWWLLRQLGRDWFAALVQTYGKPFIKGKTNVEDQQAIDFLRQAIERARRLGGIVIGHEDELELVECMINGAADAHDRFGKVCNQAISRLICGQDIEQGGNKLDAGAEAKMKGTIREDIRMMDQVKLGETCDKQIFAPALELNGLPGRVKTSWGGLSADEAAACGALLVDVKNAGLQPTDEALEQISERLGFSVERAALPDPLGVPPSGGTSEDEEPPKGGTPNGKKGKLGGGPAEGTGAAQLRSLDLRDIAARGSVGRRSIGAISPPPSDAIAARKADALALAYTGALAPLRECILSAQSAEEAQANVAKFFRDWKPERVNAITEEALQLCAAAALPDIPEAI
jgi:hypothetical protein